MLARDRILMQQIEKCVQVSMLDTANPFFLLLPKIKSGLTFFLNLWGTKWVLNYYKLQPCFLTPTFGRNLRLSVGLKESNQILSLRLLLEASEHHLSAL